MIFNSLSEVYSENERVLHLLVSRTGSLSDGCEDLRSAGGWSITQIVEHIALVDLQLLKVIEILLHKAESGSKSLSAEKGFPIDIETLVQRSRKEKYVARENAQPVNGFSIRQSLDEIVAMNRTLESLRQRLEAVDLSSAVLPHWIFGPLTLGEWLVFVGVHEERHLEQLKRILESGNLAAPDSLTSR
ncbi:MAG TPA: DinB family protein [Candidatus Kryptonia bacterium]